MWCNSVEARCRLCTGDLLPFIFLLFRKFFSDWHSVIWYIYGDFCADRCIVFIVTFPLLNMKSSGMQRRRGQLCFCFCLFNGGIKRIYLAKGSTTTQTLVEGRRCSKTSAFPLRKEGLSCHKNQRLLWQIRFFWKKKVFFYRFVGLSLSFWFFFPFGGFAVILELFLRVGNGERGLRGKWAGTV